ncbi:MAG: hypothetical protein JKY65_30135 [Planctomycetes bacterium]|nr:hypothetical protein [Planctomycetota bacterium]
MDHSSRSQTRLGADASGEAIVHGLALRLRSGEQTLLRDGHMVGGVLLGRVLDYLLESSGQREVEVLRGSEVDPKHHGRWIRAFRDLRCGAQLRSWIWVRRWATLLGFDLALLALATTRVP